MKKVLLIASACCFCLLALVNFPSSIAFPAKPEADQVGNAQELECEISVPLEARVVDGWIDVSLILKNVSEKPVRICTLCSGSRHIWKGNYKETLSPDWWKSDKPRPEKFVEKIMTLYPNETFTFPIKIHYEYSAEFFRGQPLTISAGYSTGEKFAMQYGTWAGSVEAKPITVNVVE